MATKATLTVSLFFVVIGSVGMVMFSTTFAFSTRIRDLESMPERVCGLNGYQVWSYSWYLIVVGTLGQILAVWLK